MLINPRNSRVHLILQFWVHIQSLYLEGKSSQRILWAKYSLVVVDKPVIAPSDSISLLEMHSVAGVCTPSASAVSYKELQPQR